MSAIPKEVINHCSKHAASHCSRCPIHCEAPVGADYGDEKFTLWVEGITKQVQFLILNSPKG